MGLGVKSQVLLQGISEEGWELPEGNTYCMGPFKTRCFLWVGHYLKVKSSKK